MRTIDADFVALHNTCVELEKRYIEANEQLPTGMTVDMFRLNIRQSLREYMERYNDIRTALGLMPASSPVLDAIEAVAPVVPPQPVPTQAPSDPAQLQGIGF